MDEVIFASSYDEKHPPENVFTNKNNEFFSSTGMFPQQICIQLNALKSIKTIELITYGIKRIEIIVKPEAKTKPDLIKKYKDIINENIISIQLENEIQNLLEKCK